MNLLSSIKSTKWRGTGIATKLVRSDKTLVVVVVLGETKLDGERSTVVSGVELSEKDITGDEKRAAGIGDVQSGESGGTTTIQVHHVILVMKVVAVAVDDIGDCFQIFKICAIGIGTYVLLNGALKEMTGRGHE